MKKKLLLLGGIFLFVGVISFSIFPEKPEKMSSITLSTIVQTAYAGPEGCIVNPEQLEGICKKNVSGSEWNCVEAEWWESKDCTSD